MGWRRRWWMGWRPPSPSADPREMRSAQKEWWRRHGHAASPGGWRGRLRRWKGRRWKGRRRRWGGLAMASALAATRLPPSTTAGLPRRHRPPPRRWMARRRGTRGQLPRRAPAAARRRGRGGRWQVQRRVQRRAQRRAQQPGRWQVLEQLLRGQKWPSQHEQRLSALMHRNPLLLIDYKNAIAFEAVCST
jgi:hypothetical protein